MTFAWKDKALRAAGQRGVAKARAYGLATNRRTPITLARVRFLERPIVPASEREVTGKAPARDNSSVPTRDSRPAQKSQSSVRSPRQRRGRQRPSARRARTRAGLYGRQRGAKLRKAAGVFWVARKIADPSRRACVVALAAVVGVVAKSGARTIVVRSDASLS
jgi:hypothetical protein